MKNLRSIQPNQILVGLVSWDYPFNRIGLRNNELETGLIFKLQTFPDPVDPSPLLVASAAIQNTYI